MVRRFVFPARAVSTTRSVRARARTKREGKSGRRRPPGVGTRAPTTTTTTTARRLGQRLDRGSRTRADSLSWSTATALLGCAWAGAEAKRLPVLSKLAESGPVSALLLGAVAANVGLLPYGAESDLLDIQNFCANVAMPMLLFRADLTVVFEKSLRLLLPFTVAAAGTIAGAILGQVFVFANGALFTNGIFLGGGEAYKIAAALAAKNIGGGLNYFFVGSALQMSPEAFAVGLAADNVFALTYYPLNAWLARREGFVPYAERSSVDQEAMRAIGLDVEVEEDDVPASDEPRHRAPPTIAADDVLGAVFTSVALLTVGRIISPDMMGPVATLLTVLFATLAPKSITDPLAEAGQVVGEALIFIIFVISGAAAANLTALTASTDVFTFLLVLYSCHFAFVLLPPALPFVPYERRDALLTSNACVGGPATTAALTQVLGWRDLTVPGVLIALLGNAAGTITGLSLAPLLASLL